MTERVLTLWERPRLAAAVLDTTPACPARGLEFSLYIREIAKHLSVNADFEINVNGGPRMPQTIKLEPPRDPAFWYVLDRAIAFRYGVAIAGPHPAEVFCEVPRDVLLGAMIASMRWHKEYEKATLYSVLNASRAWRYAVEGILGSKLDGADWARNRWAKPEVIDAAVQLRHGKAATLPAADVEALLGHVEDVLITSAQ